MKATIETTNHLTKDEVTAANIIAATINNPAKCNSFEQASEWLACLKPWFIYKGGNHIAVHKASGDDRRIMLIHEDRPLTGTAGLGLYLVEFYLRDQATGEDGHEIAFAWIKASDREQAKAKLARIMRGVGSIIAVDEQAAIVKLSGNFQVNRNLFFVDVNPDGTIPAAACRCCGGWTTFGGMSQHFKTQVPVLDRVGCSCGSMLNGKAACVAA